MEPYEREELRRIIKGVFDLGVNKNRMFDAMETFINTNYVRKDRFIDSLIYRIEKKFKK